MKLLGYPSLLLKTPALLYCSVTGCLTKCAPYISPFYANKGYHPKMHLQVENNAQTIEANSFVTDLRVVHNNLRKVIKDAQCHYQLSVDKRRIPVSKIEVVRGPLTHDPGAPPIASQHNFIVQPLVTKEWNARIF